MKGKDINEFFDILRENNKIIREGLKNITEAIRGSKDRVQKFAQALDSVPEEIRANLIKENMINTDKKEPNIIKESSIVKKEQVGPKPKQTREEIREIRKKRLLEDISIID